MGEFIGKVEPLYGRWHWPLRAMTEGDYFIVDKVLRSTEEVRHLMSVRAAQLGIRLSVSAHPVDHPGYTKVEMVAMDAKENVKPDGQLVDYGTAREKILAWYGFQLDQMSFGELYHKGETRVEAKQIDQPPVRRLMFTMPDGTVGVMLDEHGFTAMRLPVGSTFDSWKSKEPSLEDIMG